jgi:hypothetical protein
MDPARCTKFSCTSLRNSDSGNDYISISIAHLADAAVGLTALLTPHSNAGIDAQCGLRATLAQIIHQVVSRAVA